MLSTGGATSLLLTPRQVAQKLAVSTRTVYLWLEEGRLPAVRLSERVTRVPSQAVDELASRRRPPHSGDPRDLAFLMSHRDEIVAIARTHRASCPRVFGSVARGEAGHASDVDMLFDFAPEASLFDISNLQLELSARYGVAFDVGPIEDLKPALREGVFAEMVLL